MPVNPLIKDAILIVPDGIETGLYPSVFIFPCILIVPDGIETEQSLSRNAYLAAF